MRTLFSTTPEDSYTQSLVLTCKTIISGTSVIKAIGSEKGELLRDISFDNLFLSMADIIEPPVIKLVFRDHLWIWGLVLGIMTEIKKNLEDFRVNILLTILLISLYYLVI